jgi:hypothetical protein
MHLGFHSTPKTEMHNHSNDICINFKNRVNDPGLAFSRKVGLGPFWTLVQVLLYNDVV